MMPRFVERTANGLLQVFEQSLYAEAGAARRGFLQRLDPRAKLASALVLMASIAAARDLVVAAIAFAATVLLVLLARVPLKTFALRTWSTLLVFTLLIAVPAVFLAPHGLYVAALLVLRVESIATLAMLLVATTPWPEVLRALRSLGVPAVVVVIVSMTYRQLFIVLQRARDLFLASRSRMVGELSRRDSRRLAGSAAGALLVWSMRTSEEVYLAMQSRGFTGEVRTLEPTAMRARDYAAAAMALAAAVAIVLLGVPR